MTDFNCCRLELVSPHLVTPRYLTDFCGAWLWATLPRFGGHQSTGISKNFPIAIQNNKQVILTGCIKLLLDFFGVFLTNGDTTGLVIARDARAKMWSICSREGRCLSAGFAVRFVPYLLQWDRDRFEKLFLMGGLGIWGGSGRDLFFMIGGA